MSTDARNALKTAIAGLLAAGVALTGGRAQAQLADPAPKPPRPTEVAGFRDGFFVHDAHDQVQIFLTGLIHTDFYSSFGPGTGADAKKSALAPDVAAGLAPHLLIRRARLGLAGEIFKRWSFALSVEFGGQPLGNASGTSENAAAKPGEAPTVSSGRYAPVQTIAGAAVPLDAYINFSANRYFNIMVGQVQMPFSLENQTADAYGTWMERLMPIRAFVIPGPRDVGATVWGEVGEGELDYEVGVFGGDGQNRPSVDARVDFMTRVFAHPFARGATSDLARYFQIGVSARHGDRDASKVGYDYTPITTTQGFVLWKPTYTDSLGRQIHVLPSGAQNALGGEVRARSGRFAFQGEGYFIGNDTREAIDGYQLTNTERLGRMAGAGWYAQLTAWPAGDPFIAPTRGVYKPRHLDLSAPEPTRQPRGMQVMAVIAGVNASYQGATRLGSTPDPKTPSGNIDIYQLGVGAAYWHTRHVRVVLNYMAYLTPGSGTKDNTAVVPDNLRKLDATGATSPGHVMHELGSRVAITF